MAEARVNRPQFFSKIIGDTERLRSRRSSVAQNRKRERILLRGRKALIRSLRRNSDKRGAEPRDFRKGLLQCPQFEITIGAPAASVETENNRARGEQTVQP